MKFDEEIRNYLPPNLWEMVMEEEKRQEENIELIASENFCSDAVRAAMASCLTNKYCEGYPNLGRSGNHGRYYGGCQYIDKIEQYCCDKWREVFHTNYHVNVQPHSGSQANFAAYASILDIGDTILSMDLEHGGHLTHGSSVNFSGKIYNIIHYGVDENGYIDFNDFSKKLTEYNPKLVVAGASAYPRTIDFKKFYDIIDAYNFTKNQHDHKTYFMVDMSHIAGLIAANVHVSPFGYADIITTTTHKTLRGPRGALIFCKPKLAKKIDSAVFPYSQGGPLEHIILAKAICAEEAISPSYTFYINDVVSNCKALANEFIKLGYDLVTDGTDNHMLLINFSKTHPNLTGLEVQELCDKNKITLNKNCVPNEKRSPKITSGVRIGTAAMTTKFYTANDFITVAHKIDNLIKEYMK